jgi:hypothetical protein
MPRPKKLPERLPAFELPAIPPDVSALLAVADGDDSLRSLSALISLLRSTGVTEYATPGLTLKLGEPPRSPVLSSKPQAVAMDAIDLALSFKDDEAA